MIMMSDIGSYPAAIGADDCGCPIYPVPFDSYTVHTPDCREDAGHITVIRHATYGGRVKLVCRLCPFAETYVPDNPNAIAAAMHQHDRSTSH